MSVKDDQEFANKIVIEGKYRLVDQTPDSPWDDEDQVRFYKKNICAGVILLLSIVGLVFSPLNKEVQILSLTLAGSASSVLLNGDQKAQKKK